jgi:hypothetical protein
MIPLITPSQSVIFLPADDPRFSSLSPSFSPPIFPIRDVLCVLRALARTAECLLPPTPRDTSSPCSQNPLFYYAAPLGRTNSYELSSRRGPPSHWRGSCSQVAVGVTEVEVEPD